MKQQEQQEIEYLRKQKMIYDHYQKLEGMLQITQQNEYQEVNEAYSIQLQELEAKAEKDSRQKINSLAEYFSSTLKYLKEKHQSEQMNLQKEYQEMMNNALNLYTTQKMKLQNFIKSKQKLLRNEPLTKEEREKTLHAIQSLIGYKPTFDELRELARQLSESHYIALEKDDVASESSLIRWFEVNWEAINLYI